MPNSGFSNELGSSEGSQVGSNIGGRGERAPHLACTSKIGRPVAPDVGSRETPDPEPEDVEQAMAEEKLKPGQIRHSDRAPDHAPPKR